MNTKSCFELDMDFEDDMDPNRCSFTVDAEDGVEEFKRRCCLGFGHQNNHTTVPVVRCLFKDFPFDTVHGSVQCGLQMGHLGPHQQPKPRRCIVKDCVNHTNEGEFIGTMCSPCHQFITTGEGVHSQAYRNAENLTIKKLVAKLQKILEG